MALIACSECGREVSDKAKACPQCGYPFVQEPQNCTSRHMDFNVGAYLKANGISGGEAINKTADELYYQYPRDIAKAYLIYEYLAEGGQTDRAKYAQGQLNMIREKNPEIFTESGAVTLVTETNDASNSVFLKILDAFVGLVVGWIVVSIFMSGASGPKTIITPFLCMGLGVYMRYAFKRNRAVLCTPIGFVSGIFMPILYVMTRP